MAVTNSTFSKLDRDHRNPVAEFLWLFFSTDKMPMDRNNRPEFLMGWAGTRKAECNKIAGHFKLDGWDENATHIKMVRSLEAAWDQGKIKVDGTIAARAATSRSDPVIAAMAEQVNVLSAKLAALEGRESVSGNSPKNRTIA